MQTCYRVEWILGVPHFFTINGPPHTAVLASSISKQKNLWNRKRCSRENLETADCLRKRMWPSKKLCIQFGFMVEVYYINSRTSRPKSNERSEKLKYIRWIWQLRNCETAKLTTDNSRNNSRKTNLRSHDHMIACLNSVKTKSCKLIKSCKLDADVKSIIQVPPIPSVPLAYFPQFQILIDTIVWDK